MSDFPAETYENAIAEALKDKNMVAAVSLLRRMAVVHPRRAQVVFDQIQGTLELLGAASQTEEG